MTKTEQILNEMMEHAKAGNDIYPFMFQPMFGTSNSVSAAIRKAKKEGLLVLAGKDGMGKPYYTLPTPKATHEGSAAIN